MENTGMADNRKLSVSYSKALREDRLHASQKFEASINSLAVIVAKYGDDVLAELEGAA
ncbi:MAG: hypothetical protein LKE53_08310 [Oscillospiraceae bacterium]|jgi:hypothetical protein|nr:hypothetical protein [Oscillospiraceae bacterium]MDD3260457.1 hypothetical protein [Oscillospiraceae bacterium]